MTASELFDRLTETAKLYADFPPRLSSEEQQRAVELARRFGAKAVIGAWADYQRAKPGKPLRFFVEDCSGELRKAPQPPKRRFHECGRCGRKVSGALFLRDSGRCMACERAAIAEEPRGEFPEIGLGFRREAAQR